MRTVREGAHEVALASYQAFAGTDLLVEGIVARMLAGLSSRRYPVGLEPVGQQATGTSGSTVPCRFVVATATGCGLLDLTA